MPNNLLLLPSREGQLYFHAVLYPDSWAANYAYAMATEAFDAAQRDAPDGWSWDSYKPELTSRGFTLCNSHRGPLWDQQRNLAQD